MPVEWTPENVEIVRTMYPTSSYEEIAALIPNLTFGALKQCAHRLRVNKARIPIEKPPVIKNRPGAKKGHVPWNKKEHPEITCEICGKIFTVKAYMAAERRFCSMKCKGIASKALIRKSSCVEHICKRCGKAFKVKPVHDRAGIYQYCSNKCKYPEHVEIECKWCGKTIKTTPFQKEKGRKQFCSQGCHGAYTVDNMQRESTSIEKAVEQVLISLNETYTPQKQMGPFLLDFYLPQHRLCIECDGTYWHQLPKTIEKDQRKDHWLTSHDYKILRLSEAAIKANALQCVVDGFARHGIPVTVHTKQLQFPLDL